MGVILVLGEYGSEDVGEGWMSEFGQDRGEDR